MPEAIPDVFTTLYECFQAPIAELNCGEKCAPLNEKGVPFCCDTQHIVPTAYQPEWEYLKSKTDLWHLFRSENNPENNQLRAKIPPDQVLIECLGYIHCQRDFRSITCRAFPFYPYITRQDEFIGLSYYWEYEDRCWVISNLHVVSSRYRREFIKVYNNLFELMPKEIENFRHYSNVTRNLFSRRRRAIPLLHINQHNYKISPQTGRMRRFHIESIPKHGPYKIIAEMPFPDEVEDN